MHSFLTGLADVLGWWLIDSGRCRLILLLGTFLEDFSMLARQTIPGKQPLHALIHLTAFIDDFLGYEILA